MGAQNILIMAILAVPPPAIHHRQSNLEDTAEGVNEGEVEESWIKNGTKWKRQCLVSNK